MFGTEDLLLLLNARKAIQDSDLSDDDKTTAVAFVHSEFSARKHDDAIETLVGRLAVPAEAEPEALAEDAAPEQDAPAKTRRRRGA